MCKHELKEYVGFTDRYNYCHLCGVKESEFSDSMEIKVTNFTELKSNLIPKRTGYIELAPAAKIVAVDTGYDDRTIYNYYIDGDFAPRIVTVNTGLQSWWKPGDPNPIEFGTKRDATAEISDWVY